MQASLRNGIALLLLRHTRLQRRLRRWQSVCPQPTRWPTLCNQLASGSSRGCGLARRVGRQGEEKCRLTAFSQVCMRVKLLVYHYASFIHVRLSTRPVTARFLPRHADPYRSVSAPKNEGVKTRK